MQEGRRGQVRTRMNTRRARARREGGTGKEACPLSFSFGLTMAAMDAAVEIVFSPPARPVRMVATVEVAFGYLSDIAVGKSQRSFFW